MKKFLIFLIGITIFNCASSSKLLENLDWKLVYANDVNGKSVYGDVKTLISSIRAGKKVRMELSLRDGIFYYADATNIWIIKNTVYAQNTTGMSIEIHGKRLVFKPDTYNYWFIVDTNGYMDRIRWNVGEAVLREHDNIQVPVKWFVK